MESEWKPLLIKFGAKRLYAVACQFAADKAISIDQAAAFLNEPAQDVEHCVQEIDRVREAILKAIENRYTVDSVIDCELRSESRTAM